MAGQREKQRLSRPRSQELLTNGGSQGTLRLAQLPKPHVPAPPGAPLSNMTSLSERISNPCPLRA